MQGIARYNSTDWKLHCRISFFFFYFSFRMPTHASLMSFPLSLYGYYYKIFPFKVYNKSLQDTIFNFTYSFDTQYLVHTLMFVSVLLCRQVHFLCIDVHFLIFLVFCSLFCNYKFFAVFGSFYYSGRPYCCMQHKT